MFFCHSSLSFFFFFNPISVVLAKRVAGCFSGYNFFEIVAFLVCVFWLLLLFFFVCVVLFCRESSSILDDSENWLSNPAPLLLAVCRGNTYRYRN